METKKEYWLILNMEGNRMRHKDSSLFPVMENLAQCFKYCEKHNVNLGYVQFKKAKQVCKK